MNLFRLPLRYAFAANDIVEAATTAWVRKVSARPGDAFLCSYPKSGRTWLRFLISSYQAQLFLPKRLVTLANFAEISPNLTPFARMGLRLRMPDPRMVRLFGTHISYSRFFDGAKVIFMARDPKDTLVSYYHHRRVRGEIPEGLDRYVRSSQGLSRLLAYHDAWDRAFAENRLQPLRIQYEELLDSPLREFRRVVVYLGLPVNESALESAVRSGDSDNMRRIEGEFGNYDFTAEQIKQNPEARHVRAARAGTAREEMSAGLAAEIDALLLERGRAR